LPELPKFGSSEQRQRLRALEAPDSFLWTFLFSCYFETLDSVFDGDDFWIELRQPLAMSHDS
jgi:hypothetical protein